MKKIPSLPSVRDRLVEKSTVRLIQRLRADMRIYSSLNPLELHARGAEVCRVVLTRDRELKAEYGYCKPSSIEI